MAPPIINNDAVQGETFLPRQIFVFGGFALWANSLGRLEQIESYAPGRQVTFGSLNVTADISGDLIFNGFDAIGPRSGSSISLSQRNMQRSMLSVSKPADLG